MHALCRSTKKKWTQSRFLGTKSNWYGINAFWQETKGKQKPLILNPIKIGEPKYTCIQILKFLLYFLNSVYSSYKNGFNTNISFQDTFREYMYKRGIIIYIYGQPIEAKTYMITDSYPILSYKKESIPTSSSMGWWPMGYLFEWSLNPFAHTLKIAATWSTWDIKYQTFSNLAQKSHLTLINVTRFLANMDIVSLLLPRAFQTVILIEDIKYHIKASQHLHACMRACFN